MRPDSHAKLHHFISYLWRLMVSPALHMDLPTHVAIQQLFWLCLVFCLVGVDCFGYVRYSTSSELAVLVAFRL